MDNNNQNGEKKRQYTFLQPTYYKDFKCSGDKCSLNCCNYNWQIDVDKDSYKKYQAFNEDKETKELLKKHIKKNRHNKGSHDYAKLVQTRKLVIIDFPTIEDNKDTSYNKLIWTNSCPFQDEKGLCKIHTNFGYEGLCNTCKIFPRVVNNIFNNYERSLSLGCEEVSKLLYNAKDGIAFEIVKEDKNDIAFYNYSLSNKNEKILAYYDNIRLTCLQILQLQDLSMDNRMILLAIFMFKINEFNENKQFDKIDNYIDNFFNNINMYESLFNIPNQRQDIALQFIIKAMNTGSDNFGTEILVKEIRNVILDLIKSYADLKTENNSTFSPIYNSYRENRNKLMEDKEYFIENIFVHLFFKDNYAFNEKYSIKESCVIFISLYIYYKGLLSGYLKDIDKLNEDTLHRLTTVFGRSYSDQNLKLSDILDSFKKAQLDNLAFLSILIKSV